MENNAKLALAAAVGLLLTLSAGAQTISRNDAIDKTSIPTTGRLQEQQTNSTAGPDFVIGRDDVLKISVWKETDLSNTLTVRPDGKISVALLGDINAAGFTPTQLAANITEKLKKYISDPRVTVVVNTINSRKVFILGEVLHTGSYNLLPNMTILQALSSAGGFSQWADLKGIYVLRNEGGKQNKMRFNYKHVVKGGDVKENVVLQPGDTIVVP